MRCDTPQNFVPRGLIPRRTLLGGVQAPQDVVLRGIRPHRTSLCKTWSCGVWYPQDLVLRGLIPPRILFCGVSDPTGKLRLRRIRRKSFESLPFSLKGHFSKIVCIYKLHYPRLIVSMLKEPPTLKMVFCSAGYDTPQNHFRIWISRRIWNGNQKYFGAWIRGPYRVDSRKKPEAKNFVLLYL